ncbi:M48 family metallopeptidase [Isachenkonia alkalipeptolytica]|uniref:M48 family metallopeptidase n=1 Tax=Isachenkonia alkalipeptolytica TaxID=2565777 RepID=A0AA43XJ88_9CLOT|nr:SprT family zinc-dependent metalloprotease [Isachenkonia alkalipeptolytica]NBG87249.1 M48 family metallopeptidase [Isachenkonia alkalipeptolytica]
MEIKLKNYKIPCEIIKRKRRTMEIQVQPDGSLRVLTPKGLGKDRVQKALKEKENWIVKKVVETNRRDTPQVPVFQEGEEHYGFGHRKPLHFITVPGAGKLQVRLTGEGFTVTGEDFSQESIKKALEQWYRKQTKKRVDFYVKKYRNSLPRPTEVQVKTQKKRWGSCNHKGKVMFNWKLSMAPAWVLEYLVVHELCHREEFNHSKNFWALVKDTYAPWEEARKWLKENQGKLQGFQ